MQNLPAMMWAGSTFTQVNSFLTENKDPNNSRLGFGSKCRIFLKKSL